MTPPGLPSIDVRPRSARVHEACADAEIDALIVTSPSNIRWVTGFSGSSATVVISGGSIHLFTDSRYADRAPVELAQARSDATVGVVARELGDAVRDVLGPAARVGLEADHVTWSKQREIDGEWLVDHEVVATTGLIDRLRAAKDAAEIARIEAAAGYVDRALAEVASLLVTGLSERAFARELDAAIRAGGADNIGFDTIVASGPNGAIPHHSPGERSIARGDLVIVDVGGMVEGYRSDMTRTFCIGPLEPEQQHHYDVVVAAQQAGVDAMVADAETSAVDAAARQVITDAGWGDAFAHGTGHGVGLDIHELPRVAARVDDRYELGTVATVEPGVYLRGVGGVRIEDTCVVTEVGARRITGYPKVPELG